MRYEYALHDYKNNYHLEQSDISMGLNYRMNLKLAKESTVRKGRLYSLLRSKEVEGQFSEWMGRWLTSSIC